MRSSHRRSTSARRCLGSGAAACRERSEPAINTTPTTMAPKATTPRTSHLLAKNANSEHSGRRHRAFSPTIADGVDCRRRLAAQRRTSEEIELPPRRSGCEPGDAHAEQPYACLVRIEPLVHVAREGVDLGRRVDLLRPGSR